MKNWFTLSDGSVEAIKWCALIFMTIDHGNRFFMVPPSYQAYCIGRLALPLFCFVFAYNLSRPQFSESTAYIKSFKRLLFFGLLAIPPYRYMLHQSFLFPLNIMFTFMNALITIFFLQHSFARYRILAIACFLVCSFFVEYSWGGVLLCIGFWLLCQKRYLAGILSSGVAFFILSIINENQWALAALPFIVVFSYFKCNCPRLRYLFWIYYPGHLWLFMIISLCLRAYFYYRP